jgi:hypothetical protein
MKYIWTHVNFLRFYIQSNKISIHVDWKGSEAKEKYRMRNSGKKKTLDENIDAHDRNIIVIQPIWTKYMNLHFCIYLILHPNAREHIIEHNR